LTGVYPPSRPIFEKPGAWFFSVFLPMPSGDKGIDMMDEILKTMQLLNELLRGAPAYLYFAVVGSMVDAYAKENKISDEEVLENYKRIMEVRERVRDEACNSTVR